MLHREVNYTLKQVAKILNCAYVTVYKIVKKGELKAFKVGNDYRVRESDLKEFVNRAIKGTDDENNDM